MRILVADDTPLVRRGIVRVLRSHRFDVCAEAANGKEAVGKSQEFRPDLVLLDMNMSEIGGLETSRLFKNGWTSPEAWTLPPILSTRG